MATFLTTDLPHGLGPNYALPHAICRGSVFSSVEFVGLGARLRPVYVRPTCIAEYGPVQVFQTAGEQLNQGAADVYAELIRLALGQEIIEGQRILVHITADAFLKSIGRERGANNRIWLGEEIARLKRASFRYEMPGLKAWETSFVADFTEDRSFREVKTSAVYSIELNARMVQVYQKGWALLHAKARQHLHACKDPLGKALYSFYASHKHPIDITAKELKRLMGRDELIDTKGVILRKPQQQSKWIHDLEASLANLKSATGWHVCEYNKAKGKVTVTKQNKAKKEKTAHKPGQDLYGDADDI